MFENGSQFVDGISGFGSWFLLHLLLTRTNQRRASPRARGDSGAGAPPICVSRGRCGPDFSCSRRRALLCGTLSKAGEVKARRPSEPHPETGNDGALSHVLARLPGKVRRIAQLA